MVEFYARLVHAGKMALQLVPVKWREAVRVRLEREE